MSNRLSDAMSKLNVEGSRNSFARPPPSPGAKRNSGLDSSTINAMFPDAAAAIAQQKAEFTQHTGNAPTSNRNSAAFPGDRTSLITPTISAPTDTSKDFSAAAASNNWRSGEQAPIARPKSSSGQQHQPMGQFAQPPPSAGLRSPRPLQQPGASNIQTTTLNAPEQNEIPLLSPYNINASWASMSNTPMVPTFNHAQQAASQADMVANATAMKLAALSTVNNRIALDDVRKYRRARSNEGSNSNNQPPVSPGMPGNIPMTLLNNENGASVLNGLTAQQLMALQAQQQAAMMGQRSRPNSPGIAMQGGGLTPLNLGTYQNNGFLAAYDTSPSFGLGVPGRAQSRDGYHSDRSRGRSPGNRRGTSKAPEDPLHLDSLDNLDEWFTKQRLKKYREPFVQQGVSWEKMVYMDKDELEKMGVATEGARGKLIRVSSRPMSVSRNLALTHMQVFKSILEAKDMPPRSD